MITLILVAIAGILLGHWRGYNLGHDCGRAYEREQTKFTMRAPIGCLALLTDARGNRFRAEGTR